MEIETYTETEIAAIADAIARGMIEASDARSDGRVDADPLGDAQRTGARLEDGFRAVGGAS